jgi:hypothetical protein
MADYFSYENSNEMIKAVEIEPLEDYRLRVVFSNGETKKFDFKPKLKYPVFEPLKNKALFANVKLCKGTAVWAYDWGVENVTDGIDIAPERLYWDGVPECSL